MINIISSLMLRFASSLQMIDTGKRIEFKFPYNDELRLGLKEFGAKWDGINKVWYMGKRMRKLPEAIEFYESFRKLFEEAQVEKLERQKAVRDKINSGFPVRNLPFIHKDLARDNGGTWDANRKVWVMPTKELSNEIEAISKSLRLSLTYDDSYVAREFGGKWDKLTREWIMPDKASKDAALELLYADRLQKTEDEGTLSSGPEPIVYEWELQKPAAERAARELGFDPNTLIRIPDSASGRRKPNPKVGRFGLGKQWKHEGTLVQVVYLSEPEYEDEGMSYGLPFDQGWTWSIWAVPVVETASLQKEQERMSRSKAERVLYELENVFRQTGRNITTPTRINGEILCYRSERGSEKLFVIDGNYSWLLTSRPFMDSDMFYDRAITHSKLHGEYDGVKVKSNPKFEQILREIQATLRLRDIN